MVFKVGERGTTLSGGQKSRLSLARVLYSNRDVYLLDDFFVSLDNTVSRHVFDHAIRGLLVDKSVLLVTNNFEVEAIFISFHKLCVPLRILIVLQYLELCDEIIFMKSGKMLDQGRHQDVLLRCDEYAAFCDSSKTKRSREGTFRNVIFFKFFYGRLFV